MGEWRAEWPSLDERIHHGVVVTTRGVVIYIRHVWGVSMRHAATSFWAK